MYDTLEFFKTDGTNLKEVLKSCVYNYYVKRKDVKNTKNDLQSEKNHPIIEATNKKVLSVKKGVANVL